MDRGGAAVAPLGGLRAISRAHQWLVFLVVWLGWTLDAADFGLYSLVLRPAITDLLGGNPTMAQLGRVGGLLSMTGLLGWAVGGFLFRHHRRLYRPGAGIHWTASPSMRCSPRCRYV